MEQAYFTLICQIRIDGRTTMDDVLFYMIDLDVVAQFRHFGIPHSGTCYALNTALYRNGSRTMSLGGHHFCYSVCDSCVGVGCF
jgi:hypothetical protein